MSGLLPDLASWALRGQRPQQQPRNGDERGDGGAGAVVPPPPLTAEEMRAQRLQRMQQMQQQKETTTTAAKSGGSDDSTTTEPMMVADTTPPKAAAAAAAVAKKAPHSAVASSSSAAVSSSPVKEEAKKKRKQNAGETNKKEAEAANKKLQRRKELLLRKILSIELVTTATSSSDSADKKPESSSSSPSSSLSGSNNLVKLVMDTTDITNESITGILAERLAMSPSQLPQSSNYNQNKSLIAYLGDCHYKASEELKTMRQAAAASSSLSQKSTASNLAAQNAVIMSLLQELQNQVVTYAATILQMPDLFELGKNSTLQLAQCLLLNTSSSSESTMSSSITFGVSGSPTSSFYYLVVEEILKQDTTAAAAAAGAGASALDAMVHEIVAYYCAQLATCESVLDVASSSINTTAAPAAAAAGDYHNMDNLVNTEASPVLLVSALTALCLHKRVAQAVVSAPQFLLPRPGTREASELVDPSAGMPPTSLLQQLMAGVMPMAPKYKKRSGPALDKSTVLGLCLRIGTPKNNTPNSAFSPSTILRQSLATVESATAQQRQQLLRHQMACNQLLHNLIKAGADARNAVLQWFTDAMLVNVGATATRPDPAKVSCNSLLLNMSVALLKLCDPFVHDASKHCLIDAGFVTCPAAHQGMFTLTGDDAIRPLGAPDDEAAAASTNSGGDDAMDTYNPKNPFITSLFFLTAKSLHLGIASLLSQHENLLRHISHQHWMITSRGGDLQSDPHFAMYIARQRSNEVALFEPDMAKDTLRFLNLLANRLVNLPNEQLATMPEDFVSIVCDVVTSIAKLKTKILQGLEFRDTFELVVKLLSPDYAKMVRNPHLRATMGDVLYEIFLPSEKGDRREVPPSVFTDSAAGGQTYLLSNISAQETLAPSLLLLYGEVERTGHYEKMSHRAKISSLIQYLWESTEHRPAFRRITQNKESFVKFANGIINETNTLIATVMQKLPEIRVAQVKMENAQEWSQLTEEQQKQIADRLEDDEREVKYSLPLCNRTLQMFGYLNTDEDIRRLFLLEELCPRLVTMLLHVLTKLVGSKGLDLKVKNPEELEFKPKVMLQDLCKIFSLFAADETFQMECAKAGCDSKLLQSALKPVRKLGLLKDDQLAAFESLLDLVDAAAQRVAEDETLFNDPPEEFLDEILSTFMKDPVILPSGHVVDRHTISQHLLNNPVDPFNRDPLSIDDVKPATELKAKMELWKEEKRAAAAAAVSTTKE